MIKDNFKADNRTGDSHCHGIRRAGTFYTTIGGAAAFNGVAVYRVVPDQIREVDGNNIAISIFRDDGDFVIPVIALVNIQQFEGYIFYSGIKIYDGFDLVLDPASRKDTVI